MNLEIANRLVALRRERGLSQEDLAARLGVSRQAISKWERAESSPDTDNLIALARLYGISLDELLLQPAQGGDRCESQYAYASQTGPAAAEEAEDEQAEVFAAAREWDEAERAWEKQQKKVFEKKKQALLWLLTLVMMVALPAASAVLGLGDVYPIIVVIVFLITGFLLDNWHPGWMLFLSIPLYYAISERILGIFW